jgi:2-polyprenyl-3-methyl-5-hydroxy-6-metoxy-1,4-benzoquinol methylase
VSLTFINCCRSCKSKDISVVFELGEQALSGVFRFDNIDGITSGPLSLVQCNKCTLVQLQNSYSLNEMYNDGYGYRSGATEYMQRHLKEIVNFAMKNTSLKNNDYVLDIGCNDGTLLNNYSNNNLTRIGIDPVAKKYLDTYQDDIKVIADFFSKENYFSVASKKAKIVTSISMFYDLEDPVSFAKAVESVLSDDGVWVFEQSYLPAMLRQNSYDTICHEHLEYYSLTAITFILKEAGMTLIDASQNEVNGGSVRLAAVKNKSKLSSKISSEAIWLMGQEKNHDLYSIDSFKVFEQNVSRQKIDLINLLNELKNKKKTVIGYGASTKGNVILQYCGIDADLLPFIGDITPSKDGAFSPGTKIPIISMKLAKEMKPDYFLVLPWAFRGDILLREKETIANGTKFIFPLPFVEIVS